MKLENEKWVTVKVPEKLAKDLGLRAESEPPPKERPKKVVTVTVDDEERLRVWRSDYDDRGVEVRNFPTLELANGGELTNKLNLINLIEALSLAFRESRELEVRWCD